MPITNDTILNHAFLREMYSDSYYPDHVLDKGNGILLDLCTAIEEAPPASEAALYELTAVATERFNALEEDFHAAGSGIETIAREAICEDFFFVASAYGFPDADPEALVAERDW
ncbi:hypothetical protein JGS22_014830 [Streptomyces sp. P38-E01]|uniref:Uncharacterized protein n=1 Tax=Streptomyces tardus TaxID=2780544 RepID=A0A949JEY9_9ACTN|nr:DUF5713 family protein [Streptomyces tardus]MBU7598853.1 hypothetical protein [Streptomyces tardus]